jgi:hypothetical protein
MVVVAGHRDGRHAEHAQSHSDDEQRSLHDQVLPLIGQRKFRRVQRGAEQKFPAAVNPPTPTQDKNLDDFEAQPRRHWHSRLVTQRL